MTTPTIATNIMLDLETMSAESNAAIIEIGACAFNIETGEITDTFNIAVNLEDSAKYLDISASTVIWWLKQSEEARKNITDSSCVDLDFALSAFDTWISKYNFKHTYVWGNGASFDNVILENAYKALGKRVPFNIFNNRDCRTIEMLGKKILSINPKKTMNREGTYHAALDDAKFQAQWVSKIYQQLIRISPVFA